MKVVLDTNVFFSGIFWKGIPHQVLKKAINKEYQLIISSSIIDELIEVLKETNLSTKTIDSWERLIIKIATIIEPKIKLKIIKNDPDDDKFLECAVSTNADFLVTGDKHLLNIKEFQKTKIITPKEFLNKLKK